MRRPTLPTLMALAAVMLASPPPAAWGQTGADDPAGWALLPTRFESTGGGGWMIEDYRPVVDGATCRTDFVAVSPDGAQRFANTVRFTATPHKGGTLCTDGEWRAKDGSASGTTPIRIFIRDGVVRRAP